MLVTFTVAAANGYPAWAITGALLLVAFTVHAGAHQPAVTATVAVTVLFIPLWARVVAPAYSLSATGATSLGTTWLLFALLVGGTGVVAHLSSRGRPWVTVFAAQVAMSVPGLVTLLVLPHGGFLVAAGYTGTVLLVRSRAWPQMVDTVLGAAATVRSTWAGVNDPDVDQWERGAESEQRTGAYLSDLPHGFVIFCNRAVRGSADNVDHLVIGPTGVYILTSTMMSGRVTSDPTLGLLINEETMTGVLAGTVARSDMVARRLGIRRCEVTTVYVVYGATLEAPRQVARLFNAADVHLGEVTVLAPEAVLPEINTPLEVLSKRAVNVLRRRAARKFPQFEHPAVKEVPVPNPAPNVTPKTASETTQETTQETTP